MIGEHAHSSAQLIPVAPVQKTSNDSLLKNNSNWLTSSLSHLAAQFAHKVGTAAQLPVALHGCVYVPLVSLQLVTWVLMTQETFQTMHCLLSSSVSAASNVSPANKHVNKPTSTI